MSGGIDDIQMITPEVAGKVALYAMMAANTYHNPERIRFGLAKLGWYVVDEDGNQSDGPTRTHWLTGLAYDIYERQDTDDVVVAYRGTDSKRDYLMANLSIPPMHRQYRQARTALREYLDAHIHKNVVVTGHSLGGGLALSMSVHHGVPAFAFDPSPRIFDGFGDLHQSAPRIVVYQEGEILQRCRERWSKFSEVVEATDVHCGRFEFPAGVSAHRGDHLAKCIWDLAVTADAAWREVSVELPA